MTCATRQFFKLLEGMTRPRIHQSAKSVVVSRSHDEVDTHGVTSPTSSLLQVQRNLFVAPHDQLTAANSSLHETLLTYLLLQTKESE